MRKMLFAALLLLPVTAAHGGALAPHRAIYDLVRDPSAPGTQVDRAQGRIAFQLTGNECDGYAVMLRQVTSLDTGEGQVTVSDLRSESWENALATSYRFKTQNFVNEQIRENVNGTAMRQRNGALTVRVLQPKPASFALDGPLVLPTEHTRKMLAAAERGEKTLSVRVFDGSPDGKKIYSTLTVIGEPVAPGVGTPPPSPALADFKRYPVVISYFEMGTGERTPAYTLAFDLYENGISGALRLNYGNFALKGVLSSVELLPQKPCKAPPAKSK
ncbi:MAG: cell envelope integrity EipB family protein [Xanthobacteraceae bacterium]|nr:cell envelope integrity EipB family protein [Xanthobacteraceae bacterium]QYK43801.1 MAG: cell envelope integrity EipB family protein [Xanthobacteraceae bacterium]